MRATAHGRIRLRATGDMDVKLRPPSSQFQHCALKQVFKGQEFSWAGMPVSRIVACLGTCLLLSLATCASAHEQRDARMVQLQSYKVRLDCRSAVLDPIDVHVSMLIFKMSRGRPCSSVPSSKMLHKAFRKVAQRASSFARYKFALVDDLHIRESVR